MTALALDVRELSFDEVDCVSGGPSQREVMTAVGAVTGGALGSTFGMPWLLAPVGALAGMAYHDWLEANPREAAAANAWRVHGPSR